MKLEKILDLLNSFEKNSFLKILDSIRYDKPKKEVQEIDKILSDSNIDLKNMDNLNVSRVFSLLESEFSAYIKNEILSSTSQLDILVDIISRDGNCIMKQDWLARLYELELKDLDTKLKSFKDTLDRDKSDIIDVRIKDYKIYLACLRTAYNNDELNNQEQKITSDEQSILLTLSKELGLSQEEIKLIKYQVIPVSKLDIDVVINELKSLGIIFYSKKTNTIYIADEVVRILRKIRGKDVADKFLRRILRLLKDPQINLVCKKHNIDWKLGIDQKIKLIIKEGVSISAILSEDIYRDTTTLTEKKNFITKICDEGLNIFPHLKGSTLEEKTNNLIKYFEDVERDEKVGISIDGYEKLLAEMGTELPFLNQEIKTTFELQDENVLRSNYLLDYNIKPRDIIEIVKKEDLEKYCQIKGIKARGDVILNILDAYKDAENLYLENYENIGFRNISLLKDNGLIIKEADLGIKFEELTKKIFSKLGFNVDENLRKKLNTPKDKIDIVLNLGNNDLILVECKTIKESGYNKFSSVSRQLKAYIDLAKLNSCKVLKSLLVAPDFSDEFVKDCGLEYELNLSLITAASLIKILGGFKNSKHKQFPYNLLMRDVLIESDRVLKAIEK